MQDLEIQTPTAAPLFIRALYGLQSKIWLGVGLALTLGFAVILLYQYRSARTDAIDSLLQEARAVRTVLAASGDVAHQVLLDAGLPITASTLDLLPIHALARIAKGIQAHSESAIRIRLVSRDSQDTASRPDPDEIEILDFFSRHPEQKERLVPIVDPDGNSFYIYAQPIWTAAYCLACHGNAAQVPPELRERLAHATGYREGELRAIISIGLPTARVERRALDHFVRSLSTPLLVFLTLLLVGGALLQRLVVSKVRRMQAATQAIAGGDYAARLQIKGRDELADLAKSFNWMADSIAWRDRQLSESEEQLRLFIDHAPVALAMFDRDMRYLALSRRWATDYQLGGTDVLGLSHYEVFPEIPERWRRVHRRGLNGEVVKSDQDAFRRLDGSLQWVRWEVRPWHQQDGQVGGIVIFTEDITARKRAEEGLRIASGHNRALLEASLDPLVVIDTQGHINDVNAATEQATGYSREELMGTDFAAYFSDPERARAGYRTAFEAGQIRDHALDLAHRDGWTTPVLYNASVYRDPAGAVKQVFAAARDVTALNRMTGMLQARLRLLDHVDDWSLEEVLRASVDEAAALTESLIGFYHFLEPDQETLTLQTWSTRTLAEFCQAEGADLHYPLSQAGVWTDCIRERRAIIHNDYATLPNRRGMPEGHASVIRELVVPVMRNDRIVAILGVGNKPRDYGRHDLEIVSTFADLAWEIVERKRSTMDLRASEARYRRIVETASLAGARRPRVVRQLTRENADCHPSLSRWNAKYKKHSKSLS